MLTLLSYCNFSRNFSSLFENDNSCCSLWAILLMALTGNSRGRRCTAVLIEFIIHQQWYKHSRRRFRKHWSLFQLKQWQIFMQNNNITMMFTNHTGIISIRVVYKRIIGRYILQYEIEKFAYHSDVPIYIYLFIKQIIFAHRCHRYILYCNIMYIYIIYRYYFYLLINFSLFLFRHL